MSESSSSGDAEPRESIEVPTAEGGNMLDVVVSSLDREEGMEDVFFFFPGASSMSLTRSAKAALL